jgi:hypothetical protein
MITFTFKTERKAAQFCKIKFQNKPSPPSQPKTLNTKNSNHQCYVYGANIPKSIVGTQNNLVEQQYVLQKTALHREVGTNFSLITRQK